MLRLLNALALRRGRTVDATIRDILGDFLNGETMKDSSPSTEQVAVQRPAARSGRSSAPLSRTKGREASSVAKPTAKAIASKASTVREVEPGSIEKFRCGNCGKRYRDDGSPDFVCVECGSESRDWDGSKLLKGMKADGYLDVKKADPFFERRFTKNAVGTPKRPGPFGQRRRRRRGRGAERVTPPPPRVSVPPDPCDRRPELFGRVKRPRVGHRDTENPVFSQLWKPQG